MMPAPDHPLRRAAALVAQASGMPLAKVLRPRRHRERRQRHLAMYLAHVACARPQSDVSRAAGVTKRALRFAVQAIELRRDDPTFDDLVTRLEEELTCQ
jgi:hypothetical protein